MLLPLHWFLSQGLKIVINLLQYTAVYVKKDLLYSNVITTINDRV